MPPRAALAAAAFLLACASAPGAPARGVARLRFDPARGAALFAQAVRSVSAAGYRLHACDAERGILETGALEFDAPCRSSTCLARQSVKVRLGHRAARVTVERVLYDGALRRWVGDEAADAAARELLASLDAATGLPPGRAPAVDACAASARVEVSAVSAAFGRAVAQGDRARGAAEPDRER